MRPGAALVLPSTTPRPLAGRTILQIVPDLEAGGAERTTVDMVAGIVGAGARALVATEGGRLVGEMQARGGVWIPFPARSKNPFRMAMNVGKLKRICLDEGVDLLHARSRAPAWVAFLTARSLGLPFVTTYHGSYSGRTAAKILYNSVMARGDIVIANSHYTAGLIQRMHPFSKGKLRVIHRGTDFSRFTPGQVSPERVEAVRAQWQVLPHQRVVLLAGRLTNWKGQRVLIKAAHQLAQESLQQDGLQQDSLQDVVFILAGDPQGRDAYVRQIDKDIETLGLQKIVKRVGHCTDMPAAMLAAAVATVPSTEPEAFGRVAVEAQAMGAPVVVSELGAVPETVLGPPEVAPAERTGWRVPPDDAEELALAIREALQMGATARQGLMTRARQHVEKSFSLDHMVRETLDVYAALISDSSSR